MLYRCARYYKFMKVKQCLMGYSILGSHNSKYEQYCSVILEMDIKKFHKPSTMGNSNITPIK
jgi:hypothetical protein